MTETRALPYEWKDLRARLQARAPGLLDRLGIKDPARGGIVTPLNPTRADRRPGSFVIWVGGDAAGAWIDYATGEKGDVFDLIVYLGRLSGKMDAYWWALEFLGLGRGEIRDAGAAEEARRRAERDAKAMAAKAQADGDAKAQSAMQYWLGLAPIAGTVAEAYLREARGIPLERLRHIPGCLRFAPDTEHTDLDTGEVTRWPCMVAAMSRGARIRAVHRTWLAPDGSGKAPVSKPKKMRGPPSGSAIRLAPGRHDMSPERAGAAGKCGPLAIGEGIETTLSVACARPDYRAWAAGSLSLMGLLDWPACASGVVLLRDNDWKPEAQRAFAAVEARWRGMAKGRPLEVVASAVGSDFNDWARA